MPDHAAHEFAPARPDERLLMRNGRPQSSRCGQVPWSPGRGVQGGDRFHGAARGATLGAQSRDARGVGLVRGNEPGPLATKTARSGLSLYEPSAERVAPDQPAAAGPRSTTRPRRARRRRRARLPAGSGLRHVARRSSAGEARLSDHGTTPARRRLRRLSALHAALDFLQDLAPRAGLAARVGDYSTATPAGRRRVARATRLPGRSLTGPRGTWRTARRPLRLLREQWHDHEEDQEQQAEDLFEPDLHPWSLPSSAARPMLPLILVSDWMFWIW